MVLLGSAQLVTGSGAQQLLAETRGGAAGMYIAFEGVSDPISQLPSAGTRFAVAFAATQPSREVTFYAPYAAQATDIVLSAIGRSDGTRASVTRELLRTRVHDGILGTFSFDRQGDMTRNLIPILRVDARDGPSAMHVYNVIALAPPGAS